LQQENKQYSVIMKRARRAPVQQESRKKLKAYTKPDPYSIINISITWDLYI